MGFRLSFLQITRFPELSALRKVRDSNPRYDVMRTPHFECGSFDHSDNFPQKRVQRYNKIFTYANFLPK